MRNRNIAPTPSAALPNRALVAVLALAAAIPYVNSLTNGFVYDDMQQILNNPYIVNFNHLGQIFTTGAWSYVGKAGATNYYRPIMTFGYLLCYQLFGKVAFGYHLVNLLLHVGVVCILFGVTLALFRSRGIAFVAALVFALHPIHTESVAWIAGATELEVALFFLLAFWLYVRSARPDGGRSEGTTVAMAACFILALLSKEQALTLPLLATLYEHGYREDRKTTTWKQKLARYDVLWLLTMAYVLVRVRALGAFAPVVHAARLTWAQAFLSAPALAGHYVAKLFWPRTLCAFYVFHRSASLFDPRVLAGIAVLLALATAFRVLWKRDRVASFGILWFLATLAPVLNARWMAANVFAERYLYLPSVGFCWIMAWCAVRLWQRARARPKTLRVAMACAGILLMALAAFHIYVRNQDWRNGITLYTRTLAQQPEARPILNNLGIIYWAQGRTSEAKREWDKAYRLRQNVPPVLNNLGLYYAKEGDIRRAVSYYRRAVRLRPVYSDAHANLGVAYETMGMIPAAEIQLQAAVALSPLNARVHAELGKLFLRSGKLSQALGEFEAAVEIKPTVNAWDHIGRIYRDCARPAKAAKAFKQAVLLNPFDSVAHFNLAAIDEVAGKNDLARKEYRAGLETDPKNAAALEALVRLQSGSSHGQ